MNSKIINNERHFFLEKNNKSNLYCIEYVPHNTQKNEAVILAKPIWGERIRTHRIFTNLARQLAKEGYTVITCDYFGDGNSEGETQDLSFNGMVDDIITLKNHLINNHKINSISLIGLRHGADVVLNLVEKDSSFKQIIIIEPIIDLNKYFKTVLRANLSNQMTVHKKIIKNRTQLIEDIKNGVPVNIDGFLISKKLWESFEQVDVSSYKYNYSGDVTIVKLNGKPRIPQSGFSNNLPFLNKKELVISKEFIWDGWKYYQPAPAKFFRAIFELIDNLKEVESN